MMDYTLMGIEELEDLYSKASKAYAEGEPIMSDYEFDNLEVILREKDSPLVDKVSEDFLENQTVVSHVGVSYETFSIYSPRTEEEVIAFFKAYPEQSFVAALKVDGICTKVGYSPDKIIGESRNRSSREAINFSDAVNIMIGKLNTGETFSFTGESWVSWNDLPYFREKYDANKYVMPRSAALSLLRTPKKHDEDDVRLMRFMAFDTDNKMATYEEELEWMESIGLDIPIYKVFKIDHTKDILPQLDEVIESVDFGAPSDGVVIQVNERNIDASVRGKYLSTQIAYKLGKWAGKRLSAIVTGINFGQAKGNKGVTLEIEPVIVDNAKITKVNAYNLGVVLRLGIKKGSRIEFDRVSNNMCNIIYK